MTDPYTYIAKPTDGTYSFVNPQGKQTFNQSDISYDDASVFYDSINQSAYTYVAKPSDYAYIKKGMTSGLLIPLTYANTTNPRSNYTYVNKPTS